MRSMPPRCVVVVARVTGVGGVGDARCGGGRRRRGSSVCVAVPRRARARARVVRIVDDVDVVDDDDEDDEEAYDIIARRMETTLNDAFAALEMRARRVKGGRGTSSLASLASALDTDVKLRQAIATRDATIARAENLEEQLRVALDATREAHAELRRERARNLEEEIARANTQIRAELERARGRARELERALTEALDANETAIGIIAELRDEIDASREREREYATTKTTSAADRTFADADVVVDIDAAHAIQAHIIWRRRVARGEPGDARTDWARAEDIIRELQSSSAPPSSAAASSDAVASPSPSRQNHPALARAFLQNVTELIALGDVSAFDHRTWSIVARALRRRDAKVDD